MGGFIRGWRNRWIIASALLFANGTALGQVKTELDLEWEAPQGCPNLADLRASIRQLLGSTPGPYANSNVSVRATAIQEENGRWLGTLETRSGPNTGKRTLRAESCRAVAGATALIIALMIDPDAVVARQAQNAQLAQSTQDANAAKPAPTSKQPLPNDIQAPGSIPRSAEPTESSTRFFLGAAIALDWGNMPSLSAGVGGHLGLLTRRFSVELGLFDWTKSRTSVSGTEPAVGGKFSYLTASLSACPYWGQASLHYGLCVDAEYDRMKAEGFGASVNYGNSFRWLSIGGGALARWDLGQRVGIPIRVGAVVPLAYPVFRLNGVSEEVHRPSPVSARVMLGVDLIF